MEFNLGRDISQYERFHADLTNLKKSSLVFHYFAGHLEQCLVAALQAFHEPASLLQLFLHITTVGCGATV